MKCFVLMQWAFLLRLFGDINMRHMLKKHSEEFLAVHIKFVVRVCVALAVILRLSCVFLFYVFCMFYVTCILLHFVDLYTCCCQWCSK